nr:MAG TPA_asm: hypothetical protein [Bacteriophage sp.]DAZ21332.1 MAG TPA: hypothetical protein [Caudoviricetes sp.]
MGENPLNRKGIPLYNIRVKKWSVLIRKCKMLYCF